MLWKAYTRGREIAEHPSGFYIIRPEIEENGRPIFCPVCDYIMNSHYDEESWSKFECCDDCANSWVYGSVDRWKSGWRPTKKEILDKKKITHI